LLWAHPANDAESVLATATTKPTEDQLGHGHRYFYVDLTERIRPLSGAHREELFDANRVEMKRGKWVPIIPQPVEKLKGIQTLRLASIYLRTFNRKPYSVWHVECSKYQLDGHGRMNREWWETNLRTAVSLMDGLFGFAQEREPVLNGPAILDARKVFHERRHAARKNAYRATRSWEPTNDQWGQMNALLWPRK
jgi:hypothetical protein